MIAQKEIHSIDQLDLLARKIVEGYLMGLHKSPFHGFSAEFREHRLYNTGDPLKSIDQKVFARTDKLFVKKFDEETNLKCHMVLDVSHSMFFPKDSGKNKLDFSIVAIASLIRLLKKQRDAFGLTTFSSDILQQVDAKLSEKNKQQIYAILSQYLNNQQPPQQTSNICDSLNKVAASIQKRSLVIIFTDLFESFQTQDTAFEERFIKAIQHLSFKKNEVILFNVMKHKEEVDFEFENKPIEYIDIESGESIKLASNQLQSQYQSAMSSKLDYIKTKCIHLGIDFVEVDIDRDYHIILDTFLRKRTKLG
jgi:uncharacterized protein (DUF58 family)